MAWWYEETSRAFQEGYFVLWRPQGLKRPYEWRMKHHFAGHYWTMLQKNRFDTDELSCSLQYFNHGVLRFQNEIEILIIFLFFLFSWNLSQKIRSNLIFKFSYKIFSSKNNLPIFKKLVKYPLKHLERTPKFLWTFSAELPKWNLPKHVKWPWKDHFWQ